MHRELAFWVYQDARLAKEVHCHKTKTIQLKQGTGVDYKRCYKADRSKRTTERSISELECVLF